MSIFNLGSINIDHVHRVAHLPAPGETVSALGYVQALGGKGANQSLAAAAGGEPSDEAQSARIIKGTANAPNLKVHALVE